MSITYFKGMRTRYFNLISKELEKAKQLLSGASSATDTEVPFVCQKVSSSLTKLKEFSSKLESVCEKLAVEIESIEDENDKELQRKEEEKTSSFMETVLETICDLCEIENTLLERKKGHHNSLEKLLEIQVQLMEKMSTQTEKTSSNFKPSDTVKLPKLDIPSFDGNITNYPEFWDAFEACIHKSNLAPVEKFTYLKSKLKGEAMDAISGLSLNNKNYDEAITILKERFGDNQTLIHKHYIELIEMVTAKNTASSLRAFTDSIKTHLRSLKVLKQDITQDIFVPMITSKLPKEVILQLEIQKGRSEKWTVDKLIEQLENYVTARESTERTFNPTATYKEPTTSRYSTHDTHSKSKASSSNVQQFQTTASNNPIRSTGEALMAKENPNKMPRKTTCVYCNNSHWSDECPTYTTVEERKEKIKGRCFICFNKKTPGQRMSSI